MRHEIIFCWKVYTKILFDLVNMCYKLGNSLLKINTLEGLREGTNFFKNSSQVLSCWSINIIDSKKSSSLNFSRVLNHHC
ncbi:hypothetical protein HanXRQr2_Chr09g0389401 [Helianthus annuus]|uniref:Uncharacterized protein n=1 Tax=Helianthus annuus TaxID=4232 RepID=A0A9K3I5R2_HELAN|nr:hypothetical protein HanXRQr2_Chr09g0389401 [Helianthus annuus]KAJ0893229.1 hypothetical protein HanPSC8_Chr09g0375271 [Helianthus annuus]